MIDAIFFNNDLEKILEISDGYKYLIVLEFFENIENVDEFNKEVKNIDKKILSGIILKNLSEIKIFSNVKNRRKVDLIFIEGGDLKINREAVENVFNDFLINPFKNRRDLGFNHIFAKRAKKNKIMIAINFNDFEFKYVVNLAKICKKYKVPIAIFSFARNFYEFKDYKSLEALLFICGYEEHEISQNRKMIFEIIEENLKKRSEKWIMPGVELI